MNKLNDNEFRKSISAFCKKNEIEPATLATKARYSNRQRIEEYVIDGKGSITFKIAGRLVEAAQKIDPTFECGVEWKIGK